MRYVHAIAFFVIINNPCHSCLYATPVIDMSSVANFKYAGVLPYAVHPGDGRVYFLLGREQYIRGWNASESYSDFGGGREPGETTRDTAAREAYEESMGILGTTEQIRKRVERYRHQRIVLPDGAGAVYLVPYRYFDTTDHFARIVRYLKPCMTATCKGELKLPSCPSGHLEKTEIRWVSADELYALSRREIHTLRLRPEFLSTCKLLFEQYGFLLESPS